MEFVAFIIALAIAYQALKGYKLTKQRTLWYVHFSFAVLSAGLLIDSLTGFLGILARTFRGTLSLTWVGYSIYFLAQLLAYSMLIYAYVSQTRVLATTITAAPLASLIAFATLQTAPAQGIRLLGPLVEYHPIPEIILLFLLLYIAVQTGMNYSSTKDRSAFLVFLAFVFLTISHLFFILQPFGALLFVIGHILQLLGFVSLFTMLLRVTRKR
jgi:hypothetical protein